MITSIIRGVIRFRLVVFALVAAGILLSFYTIRIAPLDAIPDISDPQIVVYAKWPRSPELLETEVTEPLVRALTGAPGVQAVRGTSHMGYSFIYVILTDPGRRAEVQQLVIDRINTIRPQLPSDAAITLGPNASSMGWIYQYALVDREGMHDLRELRLLNEGRIKAQLQAVPGVAEVASVGGLEKQYQLKIFPPLLATTGISLKQVVTAVRDVFQETGGRTIEITNRDYQLRGSTNAADINNLEFLIVGRAGDGSPVRLKDVGYIQVGYDQRRSAADLDGTGEVVGGIVIMAHDQNVLSVMQALDRKLEEIRPALPPGVDIITAYDRSAWIWATLKEFFRTLVVELVVVSIVTILFLRNLRTAIGPIAILLLSVLFTVLPLTGFSQTINLFSLAGLCLAIGEIADATIVIVENCARELSRRRNLTAHEKREVIVHAISAVARPLLFSLLIILASFLPVFFLEERESRLFNPLAYSKTFGMAFSTVLTLCLLPILVVWIFNRDTIARRQASEGAENFSESRTAALYRKALAAMIRRRYVFTIAGMAVLVLAVVLLANIPRDFMPETDEGSILYMPTTLPGLPVREAGWILQQMDRKLKAIPEVERVFGKLGRADTSTDPAPLTMIETTILLKPRSEWRSGMTREQLIAEMDKAAETIGYVNTWVQPIRARAMMQTTGIQTPVGLKVTGPDISKIEEIAQQIEGVLGGVRGTKSVIAERISDGYYIDVQNDLQRMAGQGVMADEAMLTVRYAVGGDNLVGMKQSDGTVIPLSIQYAPEYIDTVEKVRNVPVVIGEGETVPLSAIADVSIRKMPEMIRNDNGQLAGYIYVDLQDVTAPEYVEDAQQIVAQNVTLPDGYAIEWTGLYRYAEAARARLQFIVPLTLLIIFALLMIAFKSFTESVLIMLSVPFALVGGVFLQWIMGYPMTTAVMIGYISLFAVAIQTGIIMIAFIREALDNRTDAQSYEDAVVEGSVSRLRPKLMTVATTLFSLLPIPFSQGTGMEILQPIATPSIGGMLTSTIHVLFMTPLLFVIREDIRKFSEKRRSQQR
jgi:Cu(I)/Ag(I) efflux system membrane protein CusA/SilA